MAHHAYLYIGSQEQGIAASRAYARGVLGIEGADHPDLAVYAYDGLFPIDEARRIQAFAAQSPIAGSQKLIVIAAGRLFPPAQNALLKLFEEPSEGTTLVLIIPAAGILLPTLRSRLVPLPGSKSTEMSIAPVAEAFLAADAPAREKLVAKLVARVKSDKDAEKQLARVEAVHVCEGLIIAAHDASVSAKDTERESLRLFLRDLDRFMPILHTSSAPLKLIFEHILLTMPQSLSK